MQSGHVLEYDAVTRGYIVEFEHEEHDCSDSGSYENFAHTSWLDRSARPKTAVIVPHLELAAHLDQCVDELVQMSGDQSNAQARERYVDLMVGLAEAATAIRTSSAGDQEEATARLRSAIECLRRVDATELTFPSDYVWRTQYP